MLVKAIGLLMISALPTRTLRPRAHEMTQFPSLPTYGVCFRRKIACLKMALELPAYRREWRFLFVARSRRIMAT